MKRIKLSYKHFSIRLLKGFWMLPNGMLVDLKTYRFINRLTNNKRMVTPTKLKINADKAGDTKEGI